MDNDLQKEVQRLKNEIADMRTILNKDNFSSIQIFNKEVQFNSKVRFFNKVANLSSCNTGELSVVAGKLYICSAAPSTWVCVGDQTA